MLLVFLYNFFRKSWIFDILTLEYGDRQVAPKRRQGITTVRCVISQKSIDLNSIPRYEKTTESKIFRCGLINLNTSKFSSTEIVVWARDVIHSTQPAGVYENYRLTLFDTVQSGRNLSTCRRILPPLYSSRFTETSVSSTTLRGVTSQMTVTAVRTLNLASGRVLSRHEADVCCQPNLTVT